MTFAVCVDKSSTLHWASQDNHIALVEVLLSAKADLQQSDSETPAIAWGEANPVLIALSAACEYQF